MSQATPLPRLTKKRLAALNSALSMDDVLYERFRRLNEELRRAEDKFAKSQRVLAVYYRLKDTGPLECLPVLKLSHSPEGMQVIVGSPMQIRKRKKR